MPNALFFLMLSALLYFSPAQATTPRVVTDIAPIHSLVSQVMQGVGAPKLLIKPGVSPHDYALRPSQARSLQQADLVFWVGDALTPWLERSLENLATIAVNIQLQNVDGATQLAYRTEHDHDEKHSDEHDTFDPHMWLDPENAKIWYDLIAVELAQIDPKNASIYRANAAIGKARLSVLSAEIQAKLTPVRGRGFLVFHDSLQYFETRFNLVSSGAISLGDGTAASAARLAHARETVAQKDITCVFSEPQFNAGVVASVIQGTAVKTATLDPLGVDATIGKDLYTQVLRNIAADITACLR